MVLALVVYLQSWQSNPSQVEGVAGVLGLVAVPMGAAAKAVVAFAFRPVLIVVALKCALELAVAGRYGWHCV